MEHSAPSTFARTARRFAWAAGVALCLLAGACTRTGNPQKPPKAEQAARPQTQQLRCVRIYLYNGFAEQEAEALARSLRPVFGRVEVEGTRQEPAGARCTEAKRYASAYLRDVQPLCGPGDLMLCLTPQDISLYEYKGRRNWGVMGLSYVGKQVTVVSPYRLKAKGSERAAQMRKLVLHELGHASGLPHCTQADGCLMRDAKGKNPFGRLSAFCPACTRRLSARGWKL